MTKPVLQIFDEKSFQIFLKISQLKPELELPDENSLGVKRRVNVCDANVMKRQRHIEEGASVTCDDVVNVFLR